MESALKRPVLRTILDRVSEPRKFIQVLLGPRQVGKTTLALQVAKQLKRPFHYASADIAMLLFFVLIHFDELLLKVSTTFASVLVLGRVMRR